MEWACDGGYELVGSREACGAGSTDMESRFLLSNVLLNLYLFELLSLLSLIYYIYKIYSTKLNKIKIKIKFTKHSSCL